VDDGRGAGSLNDAVRAVRVLNVMTAEEAVAAQVKPEERKRYFRADSGKANMTPPAESATWFKLVSINLDNGPEPGLGGDFVGVVTSWKLPGVFAGVTVRDLPNVQAKIASGTWAKNAAADDWAGQAIAEVLGIDTEETSGLARVKGLLKGWIASGALKVERLPDPKRSWRARPIIVVGERAEP